MKLKYGILSLLAAAFTLGACSDDDEVMVPPVQYIQLNETNITLGVTETFQLSAVITPENAVTTTATWESNNEEIVTVDENGLVTAMVEGQDTVYAVAENVKAVCIVKVVPIPVSEIQLNYTEKVCQPGTTLQLTANILPENATHKELSWESSDEKIATVDQNGLVKLGNEYGSALITAKSGNGKTGTCEVVVLGNEPILLPSVISLEKNQTQDIKILLPEALKNETVKWSSKNPQVAQVTVSAQSTKAATVKALKAGKAQIVATVAGKEYICEMSCAPGAVEIEGNAAIINLDKYAKKADVTAKIKELDGKGITEYTLYGDFQKLGMGGEENSFAHTKVVKIDFSGITPETWSEVILHKGKPAVEGIKGLPKQAFNCKKGNNIFPNLKTIILSEDAKGIGFNAFQYLTSLETIVAPGAYYLGDVMFNDIHVKVIKFTAPEEFECDFNPKTGVMAGFKSKVAGCVMYINKNKEIPADKFMFGKEFVDVLHE